jgi:hypothetical protein
LRAIFAERAMLPKAEGDAPIKWNPTGTKARNAAWLTAVLNYFWASNVDFDRSEIEDFPLVPDQHGRLHKFYHEQTPLIRPADKKLAAALQGLGLPLLSGPPALVKSMRSGHRCPE